MEKNYLNSVNQDLDQSLEVLFWKEIFIYGTLLLIGIPSIGFCFVITFLRRVQGILYQKEEEEKSTTADVIDTESLGIKSGHPTEVVLDSEIASLITSNGQQTRSDSRTLQTKKLPYNQYSKDSTILQEAKLKSSSKCEQILANGEKREIIYDEKFEIPKNDLTFIFDANDVNKIDNGNFGVVYRGFYKGQSVAIKAPCKDDSYDLVDNRKALHIEITTLSNIPLHPNILGLLGARTRDWVDGGMLCMVMELCDANLVNFLALRKTHFIDELIIVEESTEQSAYVPPCNKNQYGAEIIGEAIPLRNKELISTSDLLSFGYQTALGMEFLSSEKCLHRDLAARNLLIKTIPGHHIIKIADFGLAKQCLRNYYCQKSNALIQPIGWQSPEVLKDSKFSTASDVWAFGITLYEVMSFGETPFSNKSREEIKAILLDEIRDGKIAVKPKYCHHELFDFMETCWYFDPKRRPDFTLCANILKQHLRRANSQMLLSLEEWILQKKERLEKS